MKHNYSSFWLTAILMLVCQLLSAHDFEVDGIYYNYLSQEDKTVSVGYSYYGCYSGNVVIPASVTYAGTTFSVTSISNYAFDGCIGLTSIVIPNSVTSIGDQAFSDCTGLMSMSVAPDNSKYDSRNYCNAFIETATNTLIAGCKNTIIPNSVTSIGERAFSGCTGLTSIEIPNSVTSIGWAAFLGCTSLESIILPFVGDKQHTSSDTYQYPFGYIFGTSYYEGGTQQSYYGSNTSSTTTSTYCIPSSLKSVTITGSSHIPFGAFSNCTGLTSIVIPNSVTSIGGSAFSGCTGLTSIVIPNSVTTIDYAAFKECTGLTSIEIPNCVTSIGNYAFSGCTGLTSIEIPNSVTSIGNYAFSGCTGLTSIEIPNSVTTISNYAFGSCTGLTSIVIPNSVTSIGEGAFSSCRGLTSIEIPNSVTSIGKNTFASCRGLTSIVIPNSVTSIGERAFFRCTGLTSIEIPNSVTTISNYAFGSCTGSLIINCDIKDGGSTSGGFYGSKFREVILGEAVYMVGRYAFYNVKSIEKLTIGGNVERIGSYAFDYCTGLKSIYCNAIKPPLCSDNSFHENTKWDCPLYVPKESLDAYKAANVWKDFLNIQENPNISALESVTATDNREAPLYDLQGTQVVAPRQNGLYVHNGKKALLK